MCPIWLHAAHKQQPNDHAKHSTQATHAQVLMESHGRDEDTRARFSEIGGRPQRLLRPQFWVHVLCEIHFLLRKVPYSPRDETTKAKLATYRQLHRAQATKRRRTTVAPTSKSPGTTVAPSRKRTRTAVAPTSRSPGTTVAPLEDTGFEGTAGDGQVDHASLVARVGSCADVQLRE